ncbi:hypothetical protein ACMDCR_27435 [Labrys okinawensis]|uniref:hypothetical protein n=1 Tax=Labrys okinawensis TaxID=346911 RepID=UPI0039BC681F
MGGAIATIGLFCCLGAFIDFVLGKNGQKSLRGQLETWWLRMSYVDWGNFGQAEASLAANAMERLFGRFFSFRRLAILATLWVAAMLFLVIWPLLHTNDFWGAGIYLNAGILLFSLFHFSVSTSITIYAAKNMALYLTGKSYINLLGYLILVIFQYIFLSISVNASVLLLACFGSFVAKIFSPDLNMDMVKQIFDSFKDSLVNLDTYTLQDFFDKFYRTYMYPYFDYDFGPSFPKSDYWSNRIGSNLILLDMSLSVLISLLRLGIAAGFLITFILKPLRGLIMATLSRVIESDKPIFTLVMGAIAMVGSAANEVIKVFAP